VFGRSDDPILFLQIVGEFGEAPVSAFSGQDPVSALSESIDKPDQSVCTWSEFSAFDFRKLSLADPKNRRKFFLKHSFAELPDT
jgi:hypothetical protein